MVAPAPDRVADVRALQDRLLARMAPWGSGGIYLNFLLGDTPAEEVRAAYSPDDYARLVSLKVAYDPRNLFRVNHNIPPSAPLAARARWR